MMTTSSDGLRLLIAGSYDRRVHYAVSQLSKVVNVTSNTDHPGCDVMAGTVQESQQIRDVLGSIDVEALTAPESFLFARRDGTLVVAGSDEQGLMYGLLEIGEQLGLEGKRIDEISEVSQSPDTGVRGIFTFLHNHDCEREWFHSEQHWSDYFDLLTASRFNSFNLVFGHQTNYLAPLFPYFLEVEGHPEVTVASLTPEQRLQNLESLRMVTELAEERGLEFVLGIWEVIAWTSESRGGHTQRSLVDGLTWENLADYTYRATGSLLSEIPRIRGIQLRVNGESGVPTERQTEFFAGTIFRAMQESEHEVFLDLRGWMAEKATIERARNLGIPMRLSMKYWAEHLGPPYQAAIQEPAYSYADFLRRPRSYPAIFQVWALGSHRHFVWGDPDHVRTFASTLDLGGATGFEISPPLAQKGFGNEPGAWRVLEADHEYYRWEWERYWMFYLCFGRLTYDKSSSPAPWQRRLESRFGGAAGPVEDLYSVMSKIMSFIIAFNMSDPNMYVWPEADTGGLLDFYMSVPPSDPARFEGIEESAARLLRGESTARITALRSAEILQDMGTASLDAAREVKEHEVALSGDRGTELRAMVVDGTALGSLALYHSRKANAALSLALYYGTGDVSALLAAREQLREARQHWERLVDVTDGFYSAGQVTGPVDNGHWKDRLQLIDEDEQRVDERLEIYRRYGGGMIGGATAAFDMGAVPGPAYSYTRFPVHREMVELGFTRVDDKAKWGNPLTSSHGWDGVEGSIWAVAAPLARLSDRHLDHVYRDTMSDPGHDQLVPFTNTLFRDYVAGEGRARFNLAVAAGTYEISLLFCDLSPSKQDHGPFSVAINGETAGDDVVVAAGETHEIREVRELGRGLLSVDFESEGGKEWFCSSLLVRPVRPIPSHIPPHAAPPGSDIKLALSVTAVKGIASVQLEADSGQLSMMAKEGDEELYVANIPARSLPEGGAVSYRFRIEDVEGRVIWHPEPNATDAAPTFALSTARPDSSLGLYIAHTPITNATPGEDIMVSATVETPGLRRAVLNYRYVNQYYHWNRVAMLFDGDELRSSVPGTYVVPEWDLMYYIELFADDGSGAIVPGGENLLEVPYWVISVDR